MPLIPGFRQGDIDGRINRFTVSIEQRIIWTLAMVGEKFVNDARTIRTYKDQTGNLRSSIGYIIARDGNIIQENIEGKSEGRAQAKETANEVLRENSKGFLLIVFAGMEYAAAVESKGYDVITGSVPATKALLKSKIKEYSL
jgi:glutamine synthetase type III